MEESKALNDRKEPMVIISASGMAETGRILHHLRNNIGDPRNTVLIVSWQAPNTLGRRLADRERRCASLERFTSAAPKLPPSAVYQRTPGRISCCSMPRLPGVRRKSFLIHGEPDASEALQVEMQKLNLPPVQYPEINTQLDLI